MPTVYCQLIYCTNIQCSIFNVQYSIALACSNCQLRIANCQLSPANLPNINFLKKISENNLQDSKRTIYFVFQSAFMEPDQKDTSLETLQQIRSIMERSARFLSLSGWSGIWAGIVALAGSAVAYMQLSEYYLDYNTRGSYRGSDFEMLRNKLLILAILIFALAFIGGFYFTYRKNKKAGIKMWNTASRKMVINLAIPLCAGAVITLAFAFRGDWIYIAPACLIFYGLALINGSKYTVSDIKYLGLTEVILGSVGLFIEPGYGLYLWALGFGVLHIVYGIIMWRKYDQ